MRFDSLELPAFGPFSDFSLNFGHSAYDFHLIYGPNEAGKSSLLRAIRHLVFGIPTRTPDNFRHDHRHLLIGATVSDGKESLRFFRKKGVRNTLLDEGRHALPEDRLSRFLGAVNEEFFRHMFWLDSGSLREGAKKLLAGEGDLGTALFSASLGGSPVDEAIRRLEAEAATLCKGSAKKNTTILPAVARYKEAEKSARRDLISAHAWRALTKEVKEAEEAAGEADRRLREHERRGRLVESYLRALPILQAIRELESELAKVTVPDLPSDFPEQVREAQKSLAARAESFRMQKNRIATAERQLAEIPEAKAVLSGHTDFEMLRRRAEQFLANLEALPQLEKDLSGKEADEGPEVDSADLERVEETLGTLLELTSRQEEIARELEQRQVEISAQRRGLTEARDFSRLEEDCRRVEEFAVERAGLSVLQERLVELKREIATGAGRLEIEGDPRELVVLGEEAIRKAAREEERHETAVREVAGRLRENRDALAEEESNLKHLASQAPLYSLGDLFESRRDRDQIWTGICQSGQPDEELGRAISRCDEIADILREAADHLAAADGHQAKIARLRTKKANLENDLERARAEEAGWRGSWEPISRGRSPLELLEWRREWEQLCDRWDERDRLEAKVVALSREEEKLLQEFGGEDFRQMHGALKTSLQEANREQGERRSVEKLLTRNELKREQLKVEGGRIKRELEEQQKRWRDLCEEMQLSPGHSPASAVETLRERRETRARLRELRQRREEVRDYKEKLSTLAEQFSLEASEPVLSAFYEQARLDHDRARRLQEQLEEWRESFPEARLRFETDSARLADLVKWAGSDDLDAVLSRLERRADFRTRLSERREALASLAGDRGLEDFVKELEEQKGEALREEKEEVEEKAEVRQRERDEARSHLAELRRQQKELMQASDVVAAHKQAASDALATIVEDTTRFRQLHQAIDFLRKQVEAYRKKTQGPMLEGTSDLFRTLTGGAFTGVAAQYDENDQPQLVALRGEDEMVAMTGLSEGTADQLYLALRLAAIELHLKSHPAIPLVLDDLLMTFDDERTRALFAVLAPLSRKMQILIFTHHEHLLDLAGPEVKVHRMPGPGCGERENLIPEEKNGNLSS